MLRRAFLKRMAVAALGCGLLGSDLLARRGDAQTVRSTMFDVGKTYTIEQMDTDTGDMLYFRGVKCTSVEWHLGNGGIVQTVSFSNDKVTGKITVEAA